MSNNILVEPELCSLRTRRMHTNMNVKNQQHDDLDGGYLSISRFIRVLLLGVQQLQPQADGASAPGKHQLDKHKKRGGGG